MTSAFFDSVRERRYLNTRARTPDAVHDLPIKRHLLDRDHERFAVTPVVAEPVESRVLSAAPVLRIRNRPINRQRLLEAPRERPDA
jgi:hypothetical protein